MSYKQISYLDLFNKYHKIRTSVFMVNNFLDNCSLVQRAYLMNYMGAEYRSTDNDCELPKNLLNKNLKAEKLMDKLDALNISLYNQKVPSPNVILLSKKYKILDAESAYLEFEKNLELERYKKQIAKNESAKRRLNKIYKLISFI